MARSIPIRLRQGSRPYQILRTLAVGGGVLAITLLAPSAAAQLIRAGVRSYIRKRRFEKEKFLRDLRNLQSRELIDFRESEDGTVAITITRGGKECMLRYQSDELTLKKQKHWDGKWRLVLFDIPHGVKKARDAFRQKLRGMDFYPLQKSVFITPYPCEDEIDFLGSLLNVRSHVLILYVSTFEGEEKLKHHFHLQ